MTKEELIKYFETAPEQTPPIPLMQGTTVTEYRGFIDTHISQLKLDLNDMNSPVAMRLLKMKEYIESKQP